MRIYGQSHTPKLDLKVLSKRFSERTFFMSVYRMNFNVIYNSTIKNKIFNISNCFLVKLWYYISVWLVNYN